MQTPTPRHRLRAASVAVGLSLLMVTGLVARAGASPTAATASAAAPIAKVAFNNPAAHQGASPEVFPDRLSTEQVEATLINNAPAGSLIQASFFQFDYEPLAEALLGAKFRGVHVQLVFDGSEPNWDCSGGPNCSYSYERTITQLIMPFPIPDPETWYRTCNGIRVGFGMMNSTPIPDSGNGCLGQTMDHNKFLLFSASQWGNRAFHDIVLQSSANDNVDMYAEAFNNELVLANRASVYHDYQRYFTKLSGAYTSIEPTSRQLFTGAAGHTVDTHTIGGHDITTWSFPRAASNDPIDRQLDEVATGQSCGNHTASSRGSVPKHTHVDIAMANVSGRSAAIHRIAALARKGCSVRVVYKSMSTPDRVLLRHAHVRLYRLNLAATSTQPALHVHSKYILIAGTERGLGANRRILYTGSENLTNSSLTNSDERMIRYVESASQDPVFSGYSSNFQTMLRLAKPAQ